MIQPKTDEHLRFELTETTCQSLGRWNRDPEMVGLERHWPSRIHGSAHLAIGKYARMVRGCVTSLGLEASA